VEEEEDESVEVVVENPEGSRSSLKMKKLNKYKRASSSGIDGEYVKDRMTIPPERHEGGRIEVRRMKDSDWLSPTEELNVSNVQCTKFTPSLFTRYATEESNA